MPCKRINETDEEFTERCRLYAQDWRNNNHERLRERMNKWNRDNPEKVSIYHSKTLHKKRMKILRLLGNKCYNPYDIEHGEFLNDLRCLQIDHVNGNGSQERQEHKNNRLAYYQFIIDKILTGSKDYQLLCSNCNQIKKLLNKEVNGKLRIDISTLEMKVVV